MRRLLLVLPLVATGCYHYTFEQRAPRDPSRLVTHEEHVPTYLNGFVGNGEIDATKYCRDPVRTELRVTATDVLVSAVTLLIYTPHTLYVTCDAEKSSAAR
jgi:hypothetical protein